MNKPLECVTVCTGTIECWHSRNFTSHRGVARGGGGGVGRVYFFPSTSGT